MRELLFQILLFTGSILFGALIPLLKQDWLKKVVLLTALVGGAISILWGGYEYGIMQQSSKIKEMQLALEKRTAESQNVVKELNNENEKLKKDVQQTKAELSALNPKLDALAEQNAKLNETVGQIKKTTPPRKIRKGPASPEVHDAYAPKAQASPVFFDTNPKFEQPKESPIVLEPTWVTSNASVQAISGQVVITIYSYHNSWSQCKGENKIAMAYIDIPGNSRYEIACLNPGEKKYFDYKSKTYMLNLLEERSRNEKVRNNFGGIDVEVPKQDFKLSVVRLER